MKLVDWRCDEGFHVVGMGQSVGWSTRFLPFIASLRRRTCRCFKCVDIVPTCRVTKGGNHLQHDQLHPLKYPEAASVWFPDPCAVGKERAAGTLLSALSSAKWCELVPGESCCARPALGVGRPKQWDQTWSSLWHGGVLSATSNRVKPLYHALISSTDKSRKYWIDYSSEQTYILPSTHLSLNNGEYTVVAHLQCPGQTFPGFAPLWATASIIKELEDYIQ